MCNKVDYNIEYAHINSEQKKISKEQLKSVSITKKLINQLENNNHSYNLCVWIDNYNSKLDNLVITEFLNELNILGTPPDYIAFEKDMVIYANEIIKDIENKEESKDKIYLCPDENVNILLKNNGKISCSFLIAIWILLRFGGIKDKDNVFQKTSITSLKPKIGEKVINILPRKYKKTEKNAKYIIQNIDNCFQYSSNIEHIYF